LSRVFDVGIALVSAGAGYGKTVMVSAWASQIGGTTLAWLTCREEHNDIRRMTDELLMVLDGIAVPAGTQFGDVADALRDAGESVVIVFDDVHRLTDPTVLGALTRFLEDRPDNVVVVASGRDDSLLPWHRLSARAEVVEVRSSDLAFTPEEVRELLTATFGIDISDDAAERLCAATEGWAAGLCLAGHALRDTPKRRLIDVEQLGHHRYVRSFIDSEILDDLSADRIRFLEDTSLLQRLDPELCDLMTGRSDSHEVLKGFVECNLFTEESATSPPVYRYHALFADWLRTRVARRGSEHVAALLGIASQWYQQRGEMNLAIDAALRSGDTARVERLVQAAAGPAMWAGFAATVVRWVSALPAELLDRRPELALLLARAAGGSGDLVLARAGIASVERLLNGPTKGTVTPSMRLAYRELVFLLRLWTGDFTRAQEEIERAVALIARHPDDPGYELYSLDVVSPRAAGSHSPHAPRRSRRGDIASRRNTPAEPARGSEPGRRTYTRHSVPLPGVARR
jgi:LuxR family maltose regulon positive regulatory protein